MHLHRSCTYFNLPFFQAQMQAQTWYHLTSLDHLMAMDRGSDPIIAANSYNTPPPMHVDDKDFSVNGAYSSLADTSKVLERHAAAKQD